MVAKILSNCSILASAKDNLTVILLNVTIVNICDMTQLCTMTGTLMESAKKLFVYRKRRFYCPVKHTRTRLQIARAW